MFYFFSDPQFPHQANFIIARVSNLPILSSKSPQIIVLLRHQRPNFPFSSSGHLAPLPFLHCFIKGFQFPNFVIKGQGALNFPLRHQGPQISSSCHQKMIQNELMTSNFPSRYQGVPFIIVPRVVKGTQISQIHHAMYMIHEIVY